MSFTNSVQQPVKSNESIDPGEANFVENLQNEHWGMMNRNDAELIERSKGKRISVDMPPCKPESPHRVPSCESLCSLGSMSKEEIEYVNSLQRDHHRMSQMVGSEKRRGSTNTTSGSTGNRPDSPNLPELSDSDNEDLTEEQRELAVQSQPRRRSVSKDRVQGMTKKLEALGRKN